MPKYNIDWKAYEKYVREIAKGRAKTQCWKRLDDEINFMLGAHVIMGFLKQNDKLPSDIVWGYMGNQSALGLNEQYTDDKKKGR